MAFFSLVIPAICQTSGGREVVVCMDRRGAGHAESVATHIYREIGIELRWRDWRACPDDGIRVAFTTDTPESLMPGSLAYAIPYGDAGIRIFYDRVQDAALRQQFAAPSLLGHVLAHEIGHVLQGISRHSAEGVMKARWDTRDIHDMTRRPLPFTPIDVQLIRFGIEGRPRTL